MHTRPGIRSAYLLSRRRCGSPHAAHPLHLGLQDKSPENSFNEFSSSEARQFLGYACWMSAFCSSARQTIKRFVGWRRPARARLVLHLLETKQQRAPCKLSVKLPTQNGALTDFQTNGFACITLSDKYPITSIHHICSRTCLVLDATPIIMREDQDFCLQCTQI